MNKAATIGSFDGMHRGHYSVLDVLKDEASARNLKPMAITFDRHPLELIAPEKAPGNLMSPARKIELIEECGVMPELLSFTSELRNMRALEWLRHIKSKYGVSLVVLGYDNTFGCDGSGLGISDFLAMGNTIGIDVVRATQVEGVSSSAVRKAVRNGDIVVARDILGHLPELEGRVSHGFKEGRNIGFPTANLQVSPRMVMPLAGSYAAFANVEENGCLHSFPAMVNIGMRPTYDGTDSASVAPSVEAHIIGFDGDLYGKYVRLEFVDRLRDEKRFESVGELRAQLETDRLDTIRICETMSVGNSNNK